MTEIERFEKFREMGYVYNLDTGNVERNGKIKGYKTKKGYILLSFDKNEKTFKVRAHRFIWWLLYKEIPNEIDHINRIKDDNRIENLRNTTHNENLKNKLGKGFRKKRAGFQARIGVDRKEIYLGTYKTEQEARQAYLDAKKIYHKI